MPGEVFVYDEKLQNRYDLSKDFSVTYPYLLVNIGSGVSIIKVLSKNNFERIGGSSVGLLPLSALSKFFLRLEVVRCGVYCHC